MFLLRKTKQLGYGVEVVPGRPNKEVDTFTCAHCEYVEDTVPGMDPAGIGGLCCRCDRYICLACVGKECMPIEKRMEEYERKKRGLRHSSMPGLFDIFEGRN